MVSVCQKPWCARSLGVLEALVCPKPWRPVNAERRGSPQTQFVPASVSNARLPSRTNCGGFGESAMRLITRRHMSGMVASLLPAMTSLQAAPLQQQVPSADDKWTLPNKEKVNAGTVTIITAPAGGATSIFGSDMARVLDDDQSQLRVLPVLGRGPVRNVVD